MGFFFSKQLHSLSLKSWKLALTILKTINQIIISQPSKSSNLHLHFVNKILCSSARLDKIKKLVKSPWGFKSYSNYVISIKSKKQSGMHQSDVQDHYRCWASTSLIVVTDLHRIQIQCFCCRLLGPQIWCHINPHTVSYRVSEFWGKIEQKSQADICTEFGNGGEEVGLVHLHQTYIDWFRSIPGNDDDYDLLFHFPAFVRLFDGCCGNRPVLHQDWLKHVYNSEHIHS